MRLSLDFRRLGTLTDAPGRTFECPRTTLGTLLVLRGRSGDALRRSRDAPGTVSGRSWVPMAFQAGSSWLDWAGLDALARPGWLDLTANESPND